MRRCIIAIALLSVAPPAFAQQPGELFAVQTDGTFACRTSRATRLQGKDLAVALANGLCIQVPRGHAVRIVHDPNPSDPDEGGVPFIKTFFAPRRVELVASPGSGEWYISGYAIGMGEYFDKILSDLEKQFAKTPPSKYRTPTEVTPIAQQYLALAGISDYKFLPIAAADTELAWEYTDGSRGTLFMTQPSAKIGLTEMLAQTVQRDTAYCKGQYSSGYMPARYHLGSEIRKAYTACSDGPRSFAFYYSVVALPSGAIMRFGAGASQASMNAETVPRAERLEDAALRTMYAPPAKKK